MTKLAFTYFLIFLIGLITADDVPVIIWGPHVKPKPANALKYHSGKEFIDVLNEYLTDNTIAFIIAEDQLSTEDLSQCKSLNGRICFEGIQKIESKLYLPNVEDPAPIIEDFFGLDMVEVTLLPNGTFSTPLNHRKEKFVSINFGDDIEDYIVDEAKSVRLTGHDRMISTFYDGLISKNELEFIVILTGRRSTRRKRFVREISSLYSEATDNLKNGNSSDTPQKEADIGYIWKTEKMLLYYISLNLEEGALIKRMNVTNVNATSENYGTDESTKSEGTTEQPPVGTTEQPSVGTTEQPSVGTTEAGNQTEPQITRDTKIIVTVSVDDSDTFEFVIANEDGYWLASQFEWNKESLYSNRLISAADINSFHCTPEIRLSNRNETLAIIWEGLQLQPKFENVKGQLVNSFDDAYDCVGFVSPVILTGMLIVFMLLLVFFIGITCIMDIKPIDRFENPKGKTLTVTVDG